MAAKPPDAFLSYTRFDDQHDGGAISEFYRRLASAVRAVTGVPFDIFQDVEGIGVGEHWPGKLDEMLNEARFFIPILTPSYFTSKPCREELEKFLRAEANRKRNDLVLPIYYIECELLEDDDLRGANPLASTLHERQRQDWRELRFESFDSGNVRRTLEHLARDIVRARRRPMPQAEEGTEARRRAEEAEAKRRADQDRRKRAEQEAAERHAAEREGRRAEEAEAKRRAEEGRREPAAKGLEPSTVFRDVDDAWCPEMVAIPPGEFIMGSPDEDPDASEYEKPQHLVRIAYPLAVGRFPVTFEEYDHFVAATRGKRPGDKGWGRGRRPVINVRWDDAKAYVEWLAGETGQAYRLLSEAEWEYACRAGTATRYSWGDEITAENANYDRNISKTSEVGSYPANPFGLYDMHGNVLEWVEDCWNGSYKGAPDDGSAWTSADCVLRVLRGGSCNFIPEGLRSAFRSGDGPDFRFDVVIGFRVARTLSRSESVTS